MMMMGGFLCTHSHTHTHISLYIYLYMDGVRCIFLYFIGRNAKYLISTFYTFGWVYAKHSCAYIWNWIQQVETSKFSKSSAATAASVMSSPSIRRLKGGTSEPNYTQYTICTWWWWWWWWCAGVLVKLTVQAQQSFHQASKNTITIIPPCRIYQPTSPPPPPTQIQTPSGIFELDIHRHVSSQLAATTPLCHATATAFTYLCIMYARSRSSR